MEYELYQSYCQFVLIGIIYFGFISTYRITAPAIAYLVEDGGIKEWINTRLTHVILQ